MPLKTTLDEQPQLNLTPMIDVVFQLIIFFMVGTTFARHESRIPLQVPTVRDGGAMTAAPDKRVVNVYRDGKITLDGEELTLDDLIRQLKQSRGQYQDLGVVVRGDATGTFQQVAEVLNACKQAGIGELGISVRVARAER